MTTLRELDLFVAERSQGASMSGRGAVGPSATALLVYESHLAGRPMNVADAQQLSDAIRAERQAEHDGRAAALERLKRTNGELATRLQRGRGRGPAVATNRPASASDERVLELAARIRALTAPSTIGPWTEAERAVAILDLREHATSMSSATFWDATRLGREAGRRHGGDPLAHARELGVAVRMDADESKLFPGTPRWTARDRTVHLSRSAARAQTLGDAAHELAHAALGHDKVRGVSRLQLERDDAAASTYAAEFLAAGRSA